MRPFIIFVVFVHVLIREVSAVFYIETSDIVAGEKLRTLYECNAQGASSIDRLASLPSTSSGPTLPALPPSAASEEDITCLQVTNTRQKGQIYSTTNFFLVINPRLVNRRWLLLKSATEGEADRLPPYFSYLGVKILGSDQPDYPNYMDAYSTQEYMQARCKVKVSSRFLGVIGPDIIVRCMSVVNFRVFAHTDETTLYRFNAYNNVLANIELVYDYNYRHARQNKVSKKDQDDTLQELKSAIGFLIQRIIDPCYLLSSRSMDANSYCDTHCKFLSVAFSVFQTCGGSTDCHGYPMTGRCGDDACLCQNQASMVGFLCRESRVPMIKCSNMLRTEFLGNYVH